jgi:hypothetical protein
MRPVRLIQNGVGTTIPVVLDNYISPFNVGLGALIVSGTPTYTIQFTFDDVFAPGYDPATGNWFNHPDATSITINSANNIAFPCTAVQLNVSVAGEVEFVVIQAGVAG